MNGSLSSQPEPPPAPLLRFSCAHCGTELEVPRALAGITGPCPACGGTISAPAVPGAPPPPLQSQEIPLSAGPPAHGRRSRRPRSLTPAAAAILTAAGLAALARWQSGRHPPATDPAPLPSNLAEIVARTAQTETLRRMEAETLALASVSRYLGAASAEAAASHLLPPPQGMPSPPFPPFASPPAPESLTVTGALRMAGTDRFLVLVGPAAPAGPVFVVEQTENGPRLHSGPITQQSAGLYEKFIAAPPGGESTLYLEVSLPAPDEELAFRTQFPHLSPHPLAAVRPAFPAGDAARFTASLSAGSGAAQTFALYARDPDRHPVIARLRKTPDPSGGAHPEIVSFLTGPWSGGPPAGPPGP